MKKYDYKEEIMFYSWDDYKTETFATKMSDYFKNKHDIDIECDGKDGEHINIKLISKDNYVLLEFKYDTSLFYNCYKSNGIYECEKYKGSRSIIHKLWSYLFDWFLIITKNESLLCHECGKPTGIVFNDFDADEKSIAAGGRAHDNPKKLYGYDEDGINKCCKCGEYFCDDCSKDSHYNNYLYTYDFICRDCELEEIEDDEDYCDEGLIEKWGNCKFDDDDSEDKPDSCEDCEHYEDCLSDAEDNHDGYNSFCDCIVGHGYDSMDDFWECNGI